MRAKITFKNGHRIRRGMHPSGGGWVGDFDDGKLPENFDLALKEIILSARVHYSHQQPTGQETKATLRALIDLPDEKIPAAVRALDGWTEALIANAARQQYRNDNPALSSGQFIPMDVFDLEKYQPELFRKLVGIALNKYSAPNGRRSYFYRDVQFALALLKYWEHTFGEKATATKNGCSPFMKFAGHAFQRAGRGVADRARIFQAAIRLAHRKPVDPK